jgi:hypothetical protein
MSEHVSILKQIQQGNMDNIHSTDVPALLQFMLHNIGHTDPEIRDNLIYSGFCRLILDDYQLACTTAVIPSSGAYNTVSCSLEY